MKDIIRSVQDLWNTEIDSYLDEQEYFLDQLENSMEKEPWCEIKELSTWNIETLHWLNTKETFRGLKKKEPR